MRLAIQGIGITGGFGAGVETLRTALRTGTIVRQALEVDHHDGSVDSFFAYRAPTDGLERFLPKRELRRIDHFSKMTLYAAHLALEDSGLLNADLARTGVVVASGYGPLKTTFNFLDSYLDFGYSCSSPTHFSNSVHNAAAAHVSMQLQLTAPSLTVTQFEMSVASALLSARQWLEEGRVDRVLFGAVDEYCEVLRYCRRYFFGGGEQGPIHPFDPEVQSAMVGEGAVFFVLTRDQEAAYASIDSVTLGNHAVAPLTLPETALVVAGADGHRVCGRWYADFFKSHPVVACSPYYGSFPAAAGFDLAAAALMLRDRQLYSGPQTAAIYSQASITADSGSDETAPVCLKFGPGGDYGLICLSR